MSYVIVERLDELQSLTILKAIFSLFFSQSFHIETIFVFSWLCCFQDLKPRSIILSVNTRFKSNPGINIQPAVQRGRLGLTLQHSNPVAGIL